MIRIRYLLRHRHEIYHALRELARSLNITLKGLYPMDVLATLALCQTAVNTLKATPATPTTNFATDDVKDGISTLASSLEVTPGADRVSCCSCRQLKT